MAHHKIIFSGPVGAGKTTAITALSDVPPIETEATASDHTRQIKAKTTVALDYGVLKLDGSERIHLYGTPGQERFDFMWQILSEGAIGLVLLFSNARPEPLADLRQFLEAFRPFIDQAGFVLGITRSDSHRAPDLHTYRQHLAQAGLKAPVFEVDARQRRDVALLVEALLLSLDPGLEVPVALTVN